MTGEGSASGSPPLLEGVRVLDLTRVLAGPYATMVLADLGAQVVKVELPRLGDEARHFGPFQNGESAYFTSINRGKQSLTLDLRQRRGQEVARRLAAASEVLVENFRPGTMAAFGLDYQRLRPHNPRLVYASVSGFGQTGPYAQRPAYDIIIQAMGGIASITGMPGGPPVRVGTSIGDLGAALFAVIGILAALGRARQTGQGQHLDLSMLDCQVALLENAVARFAVSGEVPGPLGSRHPSITPFQFFPAADGHIVVAAGNDRLWQGLCQALGAGELAADPRFATNPLRTEHHGELEPVLAARFRGHGVAHWCRLLGEAGIPCGPISDVEDLFADPQVAARGMIAQVDHPQAGRQRMAASPLRFSAAPSPPLRPAPLLGQHTDEVLAEVLGMGAEERDGLRRDGVI
ncbi:MAG: CoA transferase [Candidatus Latescibacterota bacterium]